MKVGVFQSVPTPRERAALAAFATGCGGTLYEGSDGYVPCDVAVTYGMVKWRWRQTPYPLSAVAGCGTTTTVWGARELIDDVPGIMPGASTVKAQLFRRHAGPWIIVERGFVRREDYWSVGIGGINGRADFAVPADCDGRRAEALHAAPAEIGWERDGYLLVAGQVPWDVSVQDTDHVAWCRETVDRVKRLGFEVRFRPHPLARGTDYDVAAVQDTRALAETLGGARAVVTWSSTLGVDALLAGVPVIAMNRGSMAWPIAAHSLKALVGLRFPPTAHWLQALDELRLPDTAHWFARLAHCQWSVEEMRAGLPWRQLAPALEAIVR